MDNTENPVTPDPTENAGPSENAATGATSMQNTGAPGDAGQPVDDAARTVDAEPATAGGQPDDDDHPLGWAYAQNEEHPDEVARAEQPVGQAQHGAEQPEEQENPVELAEHNLAEAKRQLKQATKDLEAGKISSERYQELDRLHTTAAEDLQRVIKEN